MQIQFLFLSFLVNSSPLKAQAPVGYISGMADALQRKSEWKDQQRVEAHREIIRMLRDRCEKSPLTGDQLARCHLGFLELLQIPAGQAKQSDYEKAWDLTQAALSAAAERRPAQSGPARSIRPDTTEPMPLETGPSSVRQLRKAMRKDAVIAGLTKNYAVSEGSSQTAENGDVIDFIWVQPKEGETRKTNLSFVNGYLIGYDTYLASTSSSDAVRIVDALHLALLQHAEPPKAANKFDQRFNVKSVSAIIQTRDYRLTADADEHQIVLIIGNSRFRLTATRRNDGSASLSLSEFLE